MNLRRAPVWLLFPLELLLTVVYGIEHLVPLPVYRFAVVLSGATSAQASVEDNAWQAYEYLRGLPEGADFMTFTLVWLDLLQLVYVVMTYLAIALLADGFRRTRVLNNGAAKDHQLGRAGFCSTRHARRIDRYCVVGGRLSRIRTDDPVHDHAAADNHRKPAARITTKSADDRR